MQAVTHAVAQDVMALVSTRAAALAGGPARASIAEVPALDGFLSSVSHTAAQGATPVALDGAQFAAPASDVTQCAAAASDDFQCSVSVLSNRAWVQT